MEKAKQELLAQQAVEEGRIRVEQSKLQEEARQQVTLQQLKKQQLEAQLSVIEQETINAQAQLELTKAQQQVAGEQARVDIAKELALAKLYAAKPLLCYVADRPCQRSGNQRNGKMIFNRKVSSQI